MRGLLTALLRLNSRKTKISWPEGSMEAEVLIIAAGNGTHFGGGMKVTPKRTRLNGRSTSASSTTSPSSTRT